MSVQEINDKFLNYERLRTARKWLTRQGLSVVRIGKQSYVDKVAFEKMLTRITGKTHITEPPQPDRIQGIETKIYNELLDKL